MMELTSSICANQFPDILETIQFLSQVDRGSESLAGLAVTAEYLAGKLESLGCEVTWHPNDAYGATIVGRKKGKGQARFLFFAHMDTIWPDGTCAEFPFRIEGNLAYGPGVSDCTPGIIGSLYALKTLNDLKFDDYGEIILLFNPDEELTSPSSTQWIKHYAQDIDLAFCMEGPDNPDEFISSRAGSAYYEMRVKGLMAHAGVEPEKGRNALEELVFKLNRIQQRQIDDAYFCLCWINGGSGDCIVADNAYAMFRYRIRRFETIDKIAAMLAEVNATSFIEGTTTTITYWKDGGFGPLVKKPWVEKFCKLVEKTSADMNFPLKEGYSGGGDDAVSASLFAPTLDGLAPVSRGCHTRDERLELDSIIPRTALLATLIQQISTDRYYLRDF
jgi:glutamate carboxypeptidase